jgi:murein L,D-transpeptidase YcbB/YkuD
MRAVVLFLALGLIATGASGATHASTKKKAHARGSVVKRHSAGHTGSHTSSQVVAHTPARKGHPATRSKHPQYARRNMQAAPTPERYQEIQQALAARGYYKGPLNGAWDSDSVDALKRFQTDQNLSADGKLTPLSLIAMGLGPKRAAPMAHPAGSVEPPGSSLTPPATSVAPITVQSNITTPAVPAPAEAH